MNTGFDVAVIGGGPGGYVAAIKAAQLGGKVILFEKDTVGGTCLNRGCIPTKTYIKTAEYIKHIKNARPRGIDLDAGQVKINMADVVANKNEVVKKLTNGVAGLLDSNGVQVVKGKAVLSKERKIICKGNTYEAKSIILAGGSKPRMLEIPGINSPGVLTSDTILDLQDIPQSLVIIGGGVIGCEFATAFTAFGSEVTIVEFTDQLVKPMGKDIYQYLKKSMKKSGITSLLKTAVEEISLNGSGLLEVKTSDKKIITAEKVLVATGRSADLECLGELEKEIAMQGQYVQVDSKMRTSMPNIFCIGDMNGLLQLAHAASKMGETAAVNALGGDAEADLRFVASCLYALPEAATLGLTEEAARLEHDVLVGKFSLNANGRALASGESDGFVKVVIDKVYGEILGVQIVSPVAAEMISEAVMCMAMEITAHEVAETVHPHPTYSEAFMEACADALGKCIHLPRQ